MSRIVLIYGASGFCGKHIYKALSLYCDVIGVGFKHINKELAYSDVTKYKMVEQDLLSCQPDFIIFAAGNKNRKASFKVLYRDNVLPIRHLYKVIKKHQLKTKVIFISTDDVFAGDSGRYRDSEIPQPTTNYGKTKYLAEQALEPNPSFFGDVKKVDYRIIRTSAVIGNGSLFLSWLQQNLMKGKSFKVFNNQYLSPTSIELLTNAIIYIIVNWDKVRQPIIHICGKRMSRYQFACMVKEIAGHSSDIYKDNKQHFYDTSIIASDIQKKIAHKPMEQFLKEIL